VILKGKTAFLAGSINGIGPGLARAPGGGCRNNNCGLRLIHVNRQRRSRPRLAGMPADDSGRTLAQ
jgi:hypothetical protein